MAPPRAFRAAPAEPGPAVAPPARPESPRQPPTLPAPLPDPPRAFGPRGLQQLIPRLTRPVYRKRSPAGAMLMADWATLVGPQIAAMAVPRGLTGGTLTLVANGPAAMELTHLAPQLLARINGALGQVVVERLRLVQGVLPRPPAPPRPPPAAPVPERVTTAIGGVADPALREALERLAQGVYRGVYRGRG